MIARFLMSSADLNKRHLAAAGGGDGAAHLQQQLPAVQRDLRERPAALHPLPGNARPPRPVPQLPAHHHQGRGQVREEVSGHDHDRGEDGDQTGSSKVAAVRQRADALLSSLCS